MRIARIWLCLAIVAFTRSGGAQDADKTQTKKQLRAFVPPPWPPPLRPTDTQMKEAYAASVKEILRRSKYPPSTKVMPIEDSWFAATGAVGAIGNVDAITAYVVFDGQNSYGAMLRATALCVVQTTRTDAANCSVEQGDMIAMGMIPKTAVGGPQPKPTTRPAGAAVKGTSSKN